jgi:hypothetical protein
MSRRSEKKKGNRNPIYLRGDDPKFDNTTPPKKGIHLRGMSGFDEEQSTPSTSGFNPAAAPFTPAASTSTPDSTPANPRSVEESPEEKRAARLREIRSIEDERDREEAMNDFIWDQHVEWTAEDLAEEKKEMELEERRQKFGQHHKDSPNK